MASQVPCPHCKGSHPKQHQRFCNKNPNRVQGPGRAKAAAQKEPPAPSPAAPAEEPVPIVEAPSAGVPPPIAPAFEVAPTERVAEQMPSLEPTAPMAPPPPPPVVPPVALGPVVDVLCDLFDTSLQQAETGPSSGPPPMPAPISPQQRQALAQSLEPLFVKYLPMVGPYAIEINALMVTAAIFYPRLMAVKARRAWIEANPAPRQLPSRAPLAPAGIPEDELLRIGEKWVGRMGAPA